jgi:hypothetical protein
MRGGSRGAAFAMVVPAVFEGWVRMKANEDFEACEARAARVREMEARDRHPGIAMGTADERGGEEQGRVSVGSPLSPGCTARKVKHPGCILNQGM